MTLEERLKQLPEQLNYGNDPTDNILNDFLATTELVLRAMKDNYEEHEPYAKVIISALKEVLDNLPGDMEEVREQERCREQGN